MMSQEKNFDQRLLNRADFRPVVSVATHDPHWHSTTHRQKIDRYRDDILTIMGNSIIDPRLLDRFTSQSEDVNSVLPDNSEIALYSDLLQYVRHCQLTSQKILPVEDDAIISYIEELVAKNKSKSTINRHLSSIAWWCDYLELDDPRKTRLMKLKLKRVNTLKRTSGARGQAEALRFEHLAQALEVFSPEVARDCQDICLLFVGFETMCRRSEIVRLQWRHFSVQSDGTGLINVESSKTDQAGDGEWQYVSAMTTELLVRWRNMVEDSGPTTLIFRGVHSNGMLGEYMAVDSVNRAYKRIAKRIGLDESLFSGHSTRVGAAQEMLERNIHSSKIMLSGRWKSEAMVTRYAKKIKASSGGMAELTNLISAERVARTVAQSVDLPSPGNKFIEA
jgi:integrase/recombinase XerD